MYAAYRKYQKDEMEVIIMKNLTELVFILDRSGSMSGLEADTIGGFNSMIEKQKKEAGEAPPSASSSHKKV